PEEPAQPVFSSADSVPGEEGNKIDLVAHEQGKEQEDREDKVDTYPGEPEEYRAKGIIDRMDRNREREKPEGEGGKRPPVKVTCNNDPVPDNTARAPVHECGRERMDEDNQGIWGDQQAGLDDGKPDPRCHRVQENVTVLLPACGKGNDDEGEGFKEFLDNRGYGQGSKHHRNLVPGCREEDRFEKICRDCSDKTPEDKKDEPGVNPPDKDREKEEREEICCNEDQIHLPAAFSPFSGIRQCAGSTDHVHVPDV